MIKSSSHSTKFTNVGKLNQLSMFLQEYREAVQLYVDFIWLTIPKTYKMAKFVDGISNVYPENTNLSKRALKCAVTQALGMVKAATKKREKQLFMLKKGMKQQWNVSKLQRHIDQNPIIKPTVPYHIGAELNSICADYKTTKGGFNGFIQLKSIGKKFGKIKIPIKLTRHSIKMSKIGDLKPSFLIQQHQIGFRWNYNPVKKKTAGRIVGADQGIITTLTCSDGQVTKSDNHNHDLKSIIAKLSRSVKGSKGFKRATIHRRNYINWSINQLNFNDIKELRLEKIKHMRRGNRTSRSLSHFTYPLIRDKVIDICSQNGVRFVEQDNIYRSQRCSNCGYVHKSSRKGKTFCCKNCSNTVDADLNAALNHESNIMELPYNFWCHKLNKTGFFWTINGLFNNDGQVLTVPDGKY